MRDLLDPSSSDDEDDVIQSPETDRLSNHQAFLFGYSSLMHDLRELHPSPSQIFILWEVFKENVDPMVRILHRPTAKTILMNAASSLDRVSKPAEALLFSIYFGAVVSLTPEQCQQLLDEDKQAPLEEVQVCHGAGTCPCGLLEQLKSNVFTSTILFPYLCPTL